MAIGEYSTHHKRIFNLKWNKFVWTSNVFVWRWIGSSQPFYHVRQYFIRIVIRSIPHIVSPSSNRFESSGIVRFGSDLWWSKHTRPRKGREIDPVKRRSCATSSILWRINGFWCLFNWTGSSMWVPSSRGSKAIINYMLVLRDVSVHSMTHPSAGVSISNSDAQR